MDPAQSASFEEVERNLANQLKEKCNDRGYEKNPEETAEIFHQLGLLYMKQKDDKVSLIQSAALLAAAIIRKPIENDTIKADLQVLWKVVLQKAKARNASKDLYSISSIVREEADAMRHEAELDLNNLPKISEDLSAEYIYQMEKHKISDIQNLQEKITILYISIMKNLSEYCISVLGDPPSKCRFTLVGMGSIARKEVTPFSDFENIVVLEEGIQSNNEYESILEYFRWFSVIFQVVLISLGETILPSVAIPSLNDFCSTEGSWFYDNFTPSGISFDGLMPHACKTPLGRQKPTADKLWSTELIKPISEMLNYLDSKVDLKNGYHLADILTKTCFVSGDREVYDEFESRVNKVLEYQRNNSEEFFVSLVEQVEDDKQAFDVIKSLNKLYGDTKFNLKRVVYRSLTIFISALGKYYGVSGSSCFEIVREISHKGLLSENFTHKLNYAISIACEGRLKIYMQTQKQHDWVSSVSTYNSTAMGIVDAVGEKSTLEFFAITSSLQDSLPSFTADRLDYEILEADTSFSVIETLISFALGMYERCVATSYEELKDVFSNDDENGDNCLALIGLCHFHLKGVVDGSKDFERYLREFANVMSGSETQAWRCLRITIKCMEVNRNDWLESFGSNIIDFLPSLRLVLQNETINSVVPVDCPSDCKSNLNDEMKVMISNLEIPRPSSNISKDDLEALKALPPPILYADVLENMLQNLKQKLKSEIEDEINYPLTLPTSSAQSSSIPGSLEQIEDRKHITKASSLQSLGKFLFNKELFEEALSYFQRELEVLSDLDDKDSDVIKCKIHIGKCLYKLYDYEKALEHFQLLLCQYVSDAVNYDCIFYMGRCLFKLKRYKEATHYLSLLRKYQN